MLKNGFSGANSDIDNGGTAVDLAGRRDLSVQKVQEILKRARFYQQKLVRFDLNQLQQAEARQIADLFAEASLERILVLSLTEWRKKSQQVIHSQGLFDLLQLSVSLQQMPSEEELKALAQYPFFLSVRAQDLSSLKKFIQQQPTELIGKMRFEFQFPDQQEPEFLTCDEMLEFLNFSEKQKKTVLGPPGQEIHRQSEIYEDLHPFLEARLAKTTAIRNIKVSVVIPTFNNKFFLFNVLRHLFQQSLNPENFEVIIVDDGSQDETEQYLQRNWLQKQGPINFSYYYWPKGEKKVFRAGHARNWGAYVAQGEYLLFLDSDILLGPQFLSELDSVMQGHDVVQFIRHHIYPAQSTTHLRLEEVSVQDTYVEEASYWNQFFKSAKWEDLPFFWKYTCTYCLCLPRKLFYEVGGFRRAYTMYGFEDTDLGLRLHRQKARFHLSPAICYHLTKEEKDTNGFVMKQMRQLMLARAAKIFFRNNPEAQVIGHFLFYLQEPEVSLWRWQKKIKSTFLFWKKDSDPI